jgi:hypothetical protein
MCPTGIARRVEEQDHHPVMENKTMLKILQNYYFKTLSQNSNFNAGAPTSRTICNVFVHAQHWSRTQHAHNVLAWALAHHRELHHASIVHAQSSSRTQA